MAETKIASQDPQDDQSLKSLILALVNSNASLESDVRAVLEFHSETRTKIEKLDLTVTTIIQKLESLSREKNIILWNFPDDGPSNDNLLEGIRNIFNQVHFQLPDWAIDEVVRRGRTNGKRPVLVKFISSTWVRKAFAKAAALRKLGYPIDNDLSRGEQDARRQMRMAYNSLKNKIANCSIRKNKLHINGMPVNIADVDTILAQADATFRGHTERENSSVTSTQTLVSQTTLPSLLPALEVLPVPQLEEKIRVTLPSDSRTQVSNTTKTKTKKRKQLRSPPSAAIRSRPAKQEKTDVPTLQRDNKLMSEYFSPKKLLATSFSPPNATADDNVQTSALS